MSRETGIRERVNEKVDCELGGTLPSELLARLMDVPSAGQIAHELMLIQTNLDAVEHERENLGAITDAAARAERERDVNRKCEDLEARRPAAFAPPARRNLLVAWIQQAEALRSKAEPTIRAILHEYAASYGAGRVSHEEGCKVDRARQWNAELRELSQARVRAMGELEELLPEAFAARLAAVRAAAGSVAPLLDGRLGSRIHEPARQANEAIQALCEAMGGAIKSASWETLEKMGRQDWYADPRPAVQPKAAERASVRTGRRA